ncbi:MAG: hypothetical protein OEV64_07885 [Desulfobulbaceae bacterium]|nr:hypothetical protein [Desulfobulbaceae bacterium]
MNEQLIFTLIFLAIGFPIAVMLDRRSWRLKSINELEMMISSNDWKQLSNALKELDKRRVDLSPYLPKVFDMMLSDSKIERSAGKIALKENYRHIYDLLPSYEASGNIEKCRNAILPIIEQVLSSPPH